MDELSQDNKPQDDNTIVEGIRSQLQESKKQDKPLALDVPITPIDHTTAEVPFDESLTAFGSNPKEAPKKEIGFFEGALANLEDKNETWHLLHGGWDKTEDYLEGYKDPNFNPMQYTNKFLNVKSEYQPYLMASENEDQMNFRLKRIYHEQWVDDTVKNGSWMQWLTGGGLAIPSDLITYIPVIAEVKYAQYAKTAIRGLMKNAAGGLAFGLSGSLGEQVDRINGNLHDFLTDSVIRSVFATSLFGLGPVLSLAADKMELWKLQSYVGDAVRGIGYKLKVGEKGEVQGMQAYDMTNGSVSADKVRLAQDKADSAFHKNGFFKIPYIGTAAEKFMSNDAFGSLALSMLLSPYQSVRTTIDLAYAHGITTKGLAEGKEKPISFFTQMQKTLAHIRAEQNTFNALHMEANGIKSDNYVSQSLQQGGLYARQKSLEMIDAEIGDKPYISVEAFSDAVQQVMHSGNSHPIGAVNEAASMFKTSMDKYYKDWRIAYNLPEDWMPPLTSQQYLMRVYDTNYLNNNLGSMEKDLSNQDNNGKWIPVIANELRNQDNTIIKYMQPIRDIEAEIEAHNIKRRELLESPNVQDPQVKAAKAEAEALRIKKMVAEDNLTNQIRTNPDLSLLAHDWNALSADEAKELEQLTKRRDIAKAEVSRIKKIVSDLEAEAKKREGLANKATTVKTAKSNLRKSDIGKLEAERVKVKAELDKTEKELYDEEAKLQELAESGKVNRRFYSKPLDSNIYVFRNPNERLKLRRTYHEQDGYIADEEDAHIFRKEHAKAYYDTILNQSAEDTINQVMGRYTGNGMENHTKARTINIPDKVLYDNNFMTKDLLSKVANYKMWLARRTHLKNTYKNVSIEGGFEPIIRELQEQFDAKHTQLNQDKAAIQEKLANKKLTEAARLKLEKGLKQVDKAIKEERKAFNRGKKQMQFVYEKMAGISKLDKTAKSIVQGIKSFNVFANLGFLPATMITDLSSNGLKQGFLPFIVDGIYPVVQSLGGLLKTHDSESFRSTAGAINLALHHIGNSTASRQMDLSTNPYLNLGRIPAALDKVAHFTSNINLTTTIDNFLQRLTSAVAQSNVIRHMVAFSEGKLTKADRQWLLKYGLNPEKDSKKILAAFKKDGGGTNGLGGYQSNFWHWEDMETANKVSDAVFRSTHDTIISANSLDSPMWLDENSSMGMFAPIIRGFKGWAFASLNRYLIPSLQQPDAQKLMGFALMSASAALVSPSRRMAKGESPYRDGQTKTQIAAEILLDSPQFAWLSESLQDANLLAGGSLLGDLKNNKYYDRQRMGVLGPTATNANKLFNFMSAMATGNMNEHDTMGMASMIPVLNSLYGYNATQHIVQGFGLPKNRSK